jgi:hypothetical protein
LLLGGVRSAKFTVEGATIAAVAPALTRHDVFGVAFACG